MKNKLISMATILLLQACSLNTTEETSAGKQQNKALPVISQPAVLGKAELVKEKQELALKHTSQGRGLPQSLPAVSAMDYAGMPLLAENRENYQAYENNSVKRVAEHPLSTFSIDVDTGSYANVRRFLLQGRLPDKHAVRVEEMINYFSYDYPQPDNSDRPFELSTEIAPSPWNKNSYLLHVGLKA